jgi:hypothetical protein
MSCKDIKISEMPRACHLHGGDLIPIVQHGKNKAINVQDLVDLFKRILPPPPHPCPPPPFPGPHCPDHHGHCHAPFDPYFGDIDMQLLGKVREDAAVAKASASAVEGKLDVVEKTADVALNTSNKAAHAVRLFKEQIGKIQALTMEQAELKARVLNDKKTIKALKDAVLLLTERVKELERRAGIDDFEEINLGGDSWLNELQDPFEGHHHGHHHHHHHHYVPTNEEDDDEMTSDWVDTSIPAEIDPITGDLINP